MGFIVPPGDVEALVEKIDEAWTHPHLYKISEAARQQVQGLAPEKTVQGPFLCFRAIIDGAQ